MPEFNGYKKEMNIKIQTPMITSCRRRYSGKKYGYSKPINVYDRKEIGRVADSIAEWKRNCCVPAY